MEIFGSSKELVKSASNALIRETNSPNSIIPSDVIEKASQVAGCGFESGTAWVKQVCNKKDIEGERERENKYKQTSFQMLKINLYT